jgi:ABC-type nitrate/sulfonate/bicarbonate transport system substrate-binding protein
VLNLQGNAITLSQSLWDEGVTDGPTLERHIRSRRDQPPLTFGVVFRYSSHNFLLRKWLREHKINPDRDVRIVVVPPAQMVSNLKAANLDGYCVGEPWNSVAVRQRAGWVVATSGTISPRHPEKVLMVRRDFAETREAEHLRLIAALRNAAEYCEQPENRSQVAAILSQSRYVNSGVESLRSSLVGPFDFGHGRKEIISDFHILAGDQVGEPSLDRALWVLDQLRENGALEGAKTAGTELAAAVFRPDIFKAAARLQAISETRKTLAAQPC